MSYIAPSGKRATLVTDEKFEASDSKIISSDIYDGIIYDAAFREKWHSAAIHEYDKSKFYEYDGVPVKEHERVYPSRLIITPKGEKVLDFGIDMVGYPIVELNAKKGEKVRFSFAEILDKDGNFYNENYRGAKCRYDYTCKDGQQSFKPVHTFYGWRYLRIDEFPHEYTEGEIYAVWIHSDVKRTGNVTTSNELLNRLYQNIIRGQRGNHVDLPTDCPQRDERLGWTGDAQVFVKAAAYNFDVLEFFRKWLTDMVLSQHSSGAIPRIIPVPNCLGWWRDDGIPTSAWSDAITICPMELYLAYGDKSILTLTFDAMKKHIDCVTNRTTTKYLWTGDDQHGDWLGLDAPFGSYKGSSSEDMISSAYYAKSTEIVCKVGKILGKDVKKYEDLLANIKKTFADTYEDSIKTQTECALALHFGLVTDREKITRRLVDKIHSAGDKLETGFIGTPCILHALSENRETELAYKLLLNEEYPSWLYPVTMGATTVWEHWDGLRPDGVLWSKDMNSYNHYAYGACADWMFSVAGGINTDPDYPGYERAVIAPLPSKQIGTFSATYKTRNGEICSSWYYEGDTAHYNVTTPVPSKIIIEGKTYEVKAGTYTF
jgi:alpha-L-rhamnosidase